MASFSRGLFLLFIPRNPSRASICSQCLRHLNRTTTQTSRRTFTLSRLLSEKLKPGKKSISKPILKPKQKSLAARPSYTPDTLDPSNPADLANNPNRISPALLNAQLTSPTVVYVAPSHIAYNIAAATGGLFFAGYGLQSIQMSWLYPAAGVLPLVTYGTSIAGACMVLVGCWWSAAMLRVVKRITLIPQGRLNPPGPLLAELEVTKILPFRRHVIKMPAKDLSLVRSMESTELPEVKIDPTDVPTILKPFVWLRKVTLMYFRETRNAFMREHMIGLVVPGKGNFKVDNRGLAFGGARGMDKVFPARAYEAGGAGVLYKDQR